MKIEQVMAEEYLVETILQECWDKLLQARKDGKIPGFDIEVPAQIQSWLCDIYATQLDTLRLTDKESYNAKLFSIAMAYRISLRATVGVDYFMGEMQNVQKMQAIDKLINDLEMSMRKDNDVKRLLR